MAVESKTKILPGKKVAEFLEGIIHSGTQIHDRCVDLTAKQVYILEGPGSLDFGGSELEIGKRRKYPKVKRSREDKYGWWNLGGGQYVVEYNEKLKLPEDKAAILYPRAELLGNEVIHPTIMIEGEEELPAMCLSVGAPGIHIKENARISRLVVLDL
ncbi:MAG: hypothetical protein V3T58_04560 [Candidatus Hydrothermarchaeales archaeon]